MSQSATDSPVTEPQVVEITISVDAELLAAVDAAVSRFPGLDRGKVFDEALRMWYSNEVELDEQYAEDLSPDDLAERAAWRHIQTAAANYVFRAR